MDKSMEKLPANVKIKVNARNQQWLLKTASVKISPICQFCVTIVEQGGSCCNINSLVSLRLKLDR